MSDAAKPTASEREALIADLSDRHNPAPGHREWCPKCRAAAELSRLAAENERLHRIEARAREAVVAVRVQGGCDYNRQLCYDIVRRIAEGDSE